MQNTTMAFPTSLYVVTVTVKKSVGELRLHQLHHRKGHVSMLHQGEKSNGHSPEISLFMLTAAIINNGFCTEL